MLKIIRAGLYTSVQDGGRIGFRQSGISYCGALDKPALQIGNILVGNDPDDAALEITLGQCIFEFEQDEIPFVRRVERGAYKLTLRSLYYNSLDQQEILFEQTQVGFVRTTGGTMRKNLRRSMRYLEYAPIETISNFCNNFFRSLSEIEE